MGGGAAVERGLVLSSSRATPRGSSSAAAPTTTTPQPPVNTTMTRPSAMFRILSWTPLSPGFSSRAPSRERTDGRGSFE